FGPWCCFVGVVLWDRSWVYSASVTLCGGCVRRLAAIKLTPKHSTRDMIQAKGGAMARAKRDDASILELALVGLNIQHQAITGKIVEIRRTLGIRDGVPTSTESLPPKPKRRKISAAARKRIGDATRKRWAAYRKAKARK